MRRVREQNQSKRKPRSRGPGPPNCDDELCGWDKGIGGGVGDVQEHGMIVVAWPGRVRADSCRFVNGDSDGSGVHATTLHHYLKY